MMKLPRGVTRKGGRLFGRIHTKGGEHSFPLGPVSESGVAIQRFYTIRALIRQGTAPEAVRDALRGELGLDTLAPPKGTPGADNDMTLAKAADRWIREHVKPDLVDAPNIESRVKRVLLPFIGSKPIREVRRADCRAFRGHIRATCPKLKPGSVVHVLRTLRELLAWAEEEELIPESPWPRKGVMPHIAKRPPDRLSDAELAIAVTLPEPWGWNMRLALGTGCRWEELVKLRRTDLQSDGLLLVREAKDGEPRSIPLAPALLQEMKQHLGPLFTTRTGRPYSANSNGSFNNTIRRLAKRRIRTLPTEQRRDLEGLLRFHVHMTRHTFGCRYVEAGGELAMLQEIMGHESVTTTQIYAKANQKAVRRDAEAVYARQEANSRW